MALCASGLLLFWRFFGFWPLLRRLRAWRLARLSLPGSLTWCGSRPLSSARFGRALTPRRISLRPGSPDGICLRLRQAVARCHLDFEFNKFIPLRIGSITLGNRQ